MLLTKTKYLHVEGLENRIAAAIKNFRHHRLTQSEIAEELNISLSHVGNYAGGRIQSIEIDRVRELETILKVKLLDKGVKF